MELKLLLFTMGVTAMIKVCPNFNWLIWLDLGVNGLNEVCENVMCSHGLVEKAVYSFIAHSFSKYQEIAVPVPFMKFSAHPFALGVLGCL